MKLSPNSQGFTLLEILTVISLTGLIAAILFQNERLVRRLSIASETKISAALTSDSSRLSRYTAHMIYASPAAPYQFMLSNDSPLLFQFTSDLNPVRADRNRSGLVFITGEFAPGKGLLLKLYDSKENTDPGDEMVLFSGAVDMTCECLATNGTWISQWNSVERNGLPAMLRLTIHTTGRQGHVTTQYYFPVKTYGGPA